MNDQEMPSPDHTAIYPVLARRSGVIREIRWDDTYGKVVTLEFRVRRLGKMRTYTAIHSFMEGIIVRPGTEVRKGTVLGYRRDPAAPTRVVNRSGKEVKSLIYKGKVR